MNTMNEQSLLQEIEEDLARQRMEALWKKYGSLIISCALAIVLATAAVTAWRSYSAKQQQQTTEAYLQVAGDYGKGADVEPAKQIVAYEAFSAANKGKALAVLAQLQAAGLAVQNDQKDKALEIYNAVAADKDAEQVYRQLADLLYVNTSFDTGDAQALIARLEPLMKEGSWRYTAHEFAGHLAVRAGYHEKAKGFFSALRTLPNVPKNIEQRANDMLAWLNKGE